MLMTRRFFTTQLWLYLIALLFAVIFGYPLVWMAYSSFKPTREMVKDIWALPDHVAFNNYQDLLSHSDFMHYFQNSLIVVAVSVPMLTLISAMAAYVFARIRFRGRSILFYIFLTGMMIQFTSP